LISFTVSNLHTPISRPINYFGVLFMLMKATLGWFNLQLTTAYNGYENYSRIQPFHKAFPIFCLSHNYSFKPPRLFHLNSLFLQTPSSTLLYVRSNRYIASFNHFRFMHLFFLPVLVCPDPTFRTLWTRDLDPTFQTVWMQNAYLFVLKLIQWMSVLTVLSVIGLKWLPPRARAWAATVRPKFPDTSRCRIGAHGRHSVCQSTHNWKWR
jgi:hypothetical protein